MIPLGRFCYKRCTNFLHGGKSTIFEKILNKFIKENLFFLNDTDSTVGLIVSVIFTWGAGGGRQILGVVQNLGGDLKNFFACGGHSN